MPTGVIFEGTSEFFESKLVDVFKGIQFGTGVTGSNRFKKPQAFTYETAWVEAKKFGPGCLHPRQPWHNDTSLHFSEDCLNLNVWSPRSSCTEECHLLKHSLLKPVMVWFHGGGFITGTSSHPGYDGTALAALGDVVVVTFNYRLAAFGTLFADSERMPGNMCAYDQILALKWVRDHIAFFGGDPDKITVFGESAGSMSISALILSPLSAGLFQRAILQSGTINLDGFSVPAKIALQQTQNISKSLNCPDDLKQENAIKCIRDHDISELLQIYNIMGDGHLVYNTEFLPIRPADALRNRYFNRDIDILFGVTDNEGAAFVKAIIPGDDFDPMKPSSMSLEKAKYYIEALLRKVNLTPEKIKPIINFYIHDLADQDDYKLQKVVSKIYGDACIVCPTIRFGKYYTKNNGFEINSYSYRLMPGINHNIFDWGCSGWMGVCHGEDIPLIFGWPLTKHDKNGNFEYKQADVILSKFMIMAWTNFAKNG